jgi:hypothetical protein
MLWAYADASSYELWKASGCTVDLKRYANLFIVLVRRKYLDACHCNLKFSSSRSRHHVHFSFLFAFGFASPTPAPPAFSAMNPAPITLEGTINFNNCLYGLSSIFGTDTSDEDRCER